MKLLNLTLAALAALGPAAVPASASDFGALARQLGDAARAAGLRRVAVAPLEPARGGDDGRGAAVAERLVVALVRDGKVQAVERGLISKLADETAFNRTGAVQDGMKREMRLAPVDALVVGRYDGNGKRLRVFARVVNAETGLIVGAGQVEVEDEEEASNPFFVPVPQLSGTFPSMDGGDLRDAPASPASKCSGASERVDRMQEEVLGLKARFWAFRLRLGLDGSEVTVNPGTTILDAGLRERFYADMRAWHAALTIPTLSQSDLKRLGDVEKRSYELVRDCGL